MRSVCVTLCVTVPPEDGSSESDDALELIMDSAAAPAMIPMKAPEPPPARTVAGRRKMSARMVVMMVGDK